MRKAAAAFLALVILGALFAPVVAPFSWETQFRERIDAPPDGRFLMGTDEIGRDRFSRLVYATRTSVVLAPCAAAISIAIGLGVAMVRPKMLRSALTTICLSLPWLFLFIILRAMLPLNTSPALSITLTFALMGVAGWAIPARVFAASLDETGKAGWMQQARAAGVGAGRIALIYQWPHLRAAAWAQFRVLIPACILAEASLGLLGLGVAEPLPSWGNLLQDLQHPATIAANPLVLVPPALLMSVMICLELI